MPTPNEEDKIQPFITAAERHDVLLRLTRVRQTQLDEAITSKISAALDRQPAEKVKEDGKNGSLDAFTNPSSRGISEFDDTVYSPWQPPKFPKNKDTKEGKDGKESKDSKESKEGKESKDAKEAGKDTSDGTKIGASEASDPISRFGSPAELNWSGMNEVAKTHPLRVAALLKGVKVI